MTEELGVPSPHRWECLTEHCEALRDSVPLRPLCLFLEAQALFRVIDFSNKPQVHGRGLVTLGPSHASSVSLDHE